MTKPNVLFIITDQHRADHNGFMGNSVVQTPNLDALAAGGMVFENTWVANPVCMPNRCSILTGRMPTAHGVVFNDQDIRFHAATSFAQGCSSTINTAPPSGPLTPRMFPPKLCTMP